MNTDSKYVNTENSQQVNALLNACEGSGSFGFNSLRSGLPGTPKRRQASNLERPLWHPEFVWYSVVNVGKVPRGCSRERAFSELKYPARNVALQRLGCDQTTTPIRDSGCISPSRTNWFIRTEKLEAVKGLPSSPAVWMAWRISASSLRSLAS